MTRSLALAALATLALGSASAADTYALDPVHSVALFKVSHIGISNTWGRFNSVAGSLTWDADPAKNALTITVAIDSLDTANEKRDQHLKSPDFFNQKQYPEASFTAKSWAKTGDKAYAVTGDLTLHGVTRSVTAPAVVTGQGVTPMKDERIGLETTLVIKRSEFGMSDKLAFAGDEVTLVIAIEGIKK